jgi:hypothetical protein
MGATWRSLCGRCSTCPDQASKAGLSLPAYTLQTEAIDPIPESNVQLREDSLACLVDSSYGRTLDIHYSATQKGDLTGS